MMSASSLQLPTRSAHDTGYKRIRMLAAGGSGQVFLARRITNQTRSARDATEPSSALDASNTSSSRSFSSSTSLLKDVVVIKRILIDTQDTLQLAEKEVAIMSNLPPHPNLVKFIDAFIDQDVIIQHEGEGEQQNDVSLSTSPSSLSSSSSSFVNIVQEYAVLGDLERLLAARREHKVDLMQPREVVFLAAQLLVALRHCHNSKCLHRDLKPLNLCFQFWWQNQQPATKENSARDDDSPTEGGGGEGKEECIIAKLQRQRDPKNWTPTHPCNLAPTSSGVVGSASLAPCTVCLAFHTSISELQLQLMDLGVARTLSRTMGSTLAQTCVGTPNFLSPEMIDGSGCSFAADLWAAACVIFELCNNGAERLFGGDNMLAVVKAISLGRIKELPTMELEAAVRPLLEALVKMEPNERLTADEALKKFFC